MSYVVARRRGELVLGDAQYVAVFRDGDGQCFALVDYPYSASYFTLAEAQRFCDCMQSQCADFVWEVLNAPTA